MFKVTTLALLIALINAGGASRRLLQTGATPAEPAAVQPPAEPPLTPGTQTGAPPVEPAAPVQPVTPVQQPQPEPQPPVQQPAYNPYGQQQYNPYAYQQPAYNPYNPYNPYAQSQYNPYSSFGGVNMNNPYCNPMSSYYDMQDCYQYSYMFPQQQPQYQRPAYQPSGQQYYPNTQPAAPAQPAAPVTPGAPVNPQQPQQSQPPVQQAAYNPYGQQQYNPYTPRINMNNPYCNPYSGMYDVQDCYQYSMNPYAAFI